MDTVNISVAREKEASVAAGASVDRVPVGAVFHGIDVIDQLCAKQTVVYPAITGNLHLNGQIILSKKPDMNGLYWSKVQKQMWIFTTVQIFFFCISGKTF